MSLVSIRPWISAATLLLLSACSTMQKSTAPSQWLTDPKRLIASQQQAIDHGHWQYSAKVGVVTPQLREQANLVWKYADQANNVRLFGPLGAGAVRIEFDQYGVVLSDSKGVLHRGNSAEELLTRIVGWPIPMDALTYWLFALPNPDHPFRFRLDADGRVTELQQQGWSIEYQSYREYNNDRVLPRRLIATKRLPGDDKVEVKLVTKGWQW